MLLTGHGGVGGPDVYRPPWYFEADFVGYDTRADGAQNRGGAAERAPRYGRTRLENQRDLPIASAAAAVRGTFGPLLITERRRHSTGSRANAGVTNRCFIYAQDAGLRT